MSSRVCSVEECDRLQSSRGYCAKHYVRWSKWGDPHVVKRRQREHRVCSVQGCDQLARTKGYCLMHYRRWWRTGSTELPRRVPRVCSIDGCNRRHLSRGFCSMHYARWSRGKEIGPPLERSCEVDGCDRPLFGRGFCHMHYARWRRTGDPRGVEPERQPRETQICSFDDCNGVRIARGLCAAHYYRLRKWGDPRGKRVRSNQERFLEKVEMSDDGCWLWLAGTKNGRYGVFTVNESTYWRARGTGSAHREMMAHRYAYEALVGPIPEDHDIDHLCGNSLCVNPDHLEAVTPWENRRRAATRSRRGVGLIAQAIR
jgi:HNH endonuclease